MCRATDTVSNWAVSRHVTVGRRCTTIRRASSHPPSVSGHFASFQAKFLGGRGSRAASAPAVVDTAYSLGRLCHSSARSLAASSAANKPGCEQSRLIAQVQLGSGPNTSATATAAASLVGRGKLHSAVRSGRPFLLSAFVHQALHPVSHKRPPAYLWTDRYAPRQLPVLFPDRSVFSAGFRFRAVGHDGVSCCGTSWRGRFSAYRPLCVPHAKPYQALL